VADTNPRSWTQKPTHPGYWWRSERLGPRRYKTTLASVTVQRVNRDQLMYDGQVLLAEPSVVWSPVNLPEPAETDFAVR
jgi:hypothetical protein